MSLVLNDYESLYEILAEDTDDKIEWYTSFKNIYFYSLDNELMIRDNSSDFLSSITLARILINHKHKGTATKIIKFLENYAKDNHAKKVVIESILSKEMLNLAINLGYTEDPYNHGNYVKLI